MRQVIARYTICCLLGIAHAIPGNAAPPAEETPRWKRYLLPVVTTTQPVSGVHGSLWVAESWFSYAGEIQTSVAPVILRCPFECPLPLPIGPKLPPTRLTVFPLHDTALLVHVGAAEADFFTFESRIRDLSREDESAGTEIPVISEDKMSGLPRRLLDIPLRVKFRHMLRIYALPEVAQPEVEVRYFRMPGIEQAEPVLLRTDRVSLRHRKPSPVEERSGIHGLIPSIAEIGNVQNLPELLGHGNIWIEVIPVTPNLRVWAFVSITNDETQQVTIVTP